MIVTRFSPNLNATEHLGHAFTMLVNEYYAHSVDGKFYVRFDDTSYTSQSSGCRIHKIRHIQKKLIEWLEIPVDGWILQSVEMEYVNEVLKKYDIPSEDQTGYVLPYSIRFGTTFVFYPYTPLQTAQRVIMDNMIGVTDVIRGDDFITEYSLYSYYCQVFNYPAPKFWYLPRLSFDGKDISKTNGGFTIAEYKANGYTANDIKNILKKSCLIEPKNGWMLQNIKANPVLTI